MGNPDPPAREKREKKRRQPKPGDPITMPAWMFLPLSILTVGASFLFFRRGDPVAAVTVLVVALCAWTGFKMGLVRITATVGGLALAIAFAPYMGMQYEQAFSDRVGTTGLLNRFLCIALIGVLISLVASLLTSFLGTKLIAKRRKLRWADSMLGFSIGIAEGVVLALLILGGLLSLQMWQRGDDIDDNQVALAVDEWASRTRQSAVGPLVRDCNPFEYFEALKSIGDYRQAAQQFQDPKRIQQLLQDPRIAELRSDPAVAGAIEEILGDEEINGLVELEQPINRQLVLRLMSSPNVMQLIDSPEFLERAKAILKE